MGFNIMPFEEIQKKLVPNTGEMDPGLAVKL